MVSYSDKKVFLVINTSYFGDVLLCNPLCQNIKNIYPNSKIVFVVDKPFVDAASFQKDVDEVVVYDKRGLHKGIWGFIKFIRDFKYRGAFASFVTYRNFRNVILSIFVGAKHICAAKKVKEKIPVWRQHVELLSVITNSELKNYPMVYNSKIEIPERINNVLNPGKKYISLCATTKNPKKDIPLDISTELIEKLNNDGFEVILTGAGKAAEEYSQALLARKSKFIDLVNKTSIYELGCVLKMSKLLVSADTGTMHMGCACQVPTVAIFYEKDKVPYWAPDSNIYNSVVISENQTAENIYNSVRGLIYG